MTTSIMTNRNFFKAVANGKTITNEMREKANEMLAKMDEANAKRSSKPSKAQIANEPIKAKILEILATAPMTSAVLREKFVENGEEISVQKVSSLCRQLAGDGLLVESEVKIPKKGVQKQYAVPSTDVENEGD